MKFTLIATIVVLALAHGSLAQELFDMEKIGQYVEEMKTKMTKDLTEFTRNNDLATQAQTFLEEKKNEMQPMLDQFQEQLKSAVANMETQATNVQTQIQPIMEQFQLQLEALVKQVTDKAKALSN
ncbi:type-4 ice-structuring protein-like [Synchiropus picturatus]